MSAIKSLVMDIEARLLEGRSKIDQEWISYELNVPLDLVEDVLVNLDQELQSAMEYQQEYADMMA